MPYLKSLQKLFICSVLRIYLCFTEHTWKMKKHFPKAACVQIHKWEEKRFFFIFLIDDLTDLGKYFTFDWSIAEDFNSWTRLGFALVSDRSKFIEIKNSCRTRIVVFTQTKVQSRWFNQSVTPLTIPIVHIENTLSKHVNHNWYVDEIYFLPCCSSIQIDFPCSLFSSDLTRSKKMFTPDVIKNIFCYLFTHRSFEII